MGSLQTSKINCIRNAIDFRRLLIVSKHMRKVMIRFQTPKLPFRFGGLIKPSSPEYINPTKSQKTWSVLERKLGSSLDFHFTVRVAVGRWKKLGFIKCGDPKWTYGIWGKKPSSIRYFDYNSFETAFFEANSEWRFQNWLWNTYHRASSSRYSQRICCRASPICSANGHLRQKKI